MNLGEGTRIEYHTDKTYPDWLFNKFSREVKDMLQNDRENGTITPQINDRNGGGRSEGRGGNRGGYDSNKRKIEKLEQSFDDMNSQGVPF